MVIKLQFTCILLFIAQLLQAQLTFDWLKKVDGVAANGLSISLDKAENMVIAGTFQYSMDLDPGPDTVRISNGGDVDVFVQKLTKDGGFLWGRHIKGSNNEAMLNATLDTAGNVFVVGYFAQTITFDSAVTFTASTWDTLDIYIAKYSAAGNLLWAKQLGGPGADYGYSMVTDEAGNLYMTGFYHNGADLDPDTLVSNILNTQQNGAMFILKLSPGGNLVWVKSTAGTNGYSVGRDVTIDGAYLYATGTFNGVIDFDPGAGVSNLTGQNYATFVEKMDTAGNFKWVRQIQSTGNTVGYNIKVDHLGNIISTGEFNGTIDLNPGAGVASFSSFGGDDFYIQKLSPSGNYLWGKTVGGTGSDWCSGIDIDETNNLYLTGFFYNTVDFNPGPGVYNLYNPTTQYDIFVAKLDPNGNFAGVEQIGGPKRQYANDIILNENKDVFVLGYTLGYTDFDPGVDSFIVDEFHKMFILKLSQPWDFQGTVYQDLNNNQLRDPGEPGVFGVIVAAQHKQVYSSTDSAGVYHIYQNVSGDSIRAVPTRPYWTALPAWVGVDTSLVIPPIGMTIPVVKDVQITAVALTNFRPGFNTNVLIQVENTGALPVYNLPIRLKLLKPDLGFEGAVPMQEALIQDTIYWTIDSLNVHDVFDIQAELHTKISNTNGTPVKIIAEAVLPEDADQSNNVASIQKTVVGSFDPNDKQVSPKQVAPDALETTNLQYVIRFQNTGNFPADLVVLRDTLSADLDLSTLKVLAASHAYTWSLKAKRVLEFRFNAINLPDSSSNEPESHGFVVFSIRPGKGLTTGDSILNRAGIYFDFNAPIITNSAVMHVAPIVKIIEPTLTEFLDFQISPNPVAEQNAVEVRLSEPLSTELLVTIYNVQGQLLQQSMAKAGVRTVPINGLPTGTYFVHIYGSNRMGGKILVVD
jgi:hypothetical protein